MDVRLEVSLFVFTVVEKPDLWPEKSARAGTPVTSYEHVESMQWHQLNVFNKECAIVVWSAARVPRQRRQCVPSDPTLGGA